MPARARGVLKAASVFGQRFSSHGVAALVGGAPDSRTVEWLEMLADRAGERRAKALRLRRTTNTRPPCLAARGRIRNAHGWRSRSGSCAGRRLARAGRRCPADRARRAFRQGRAAASCLAVLCGVRAEDALEANDFETAILLATSHVLPPRNPTRSRVGTALAHPGSGVQVAREPYEALRCAQEAMIQCHAVERRGAPQPGAHAGIVEGRTRDVVLDLARELGTVLADDGVPGAVIAAAAQASSCLATFGLHNLAQDLLEACKVERAVNVHPEACARLLIARGHAALVRGDPFEYMQLSTKPLRRWSSAATCGLAASCAARLASPCASWVASPRRGPPRGAGHRRQKWVSLL